MNKIIRDTFLIGKNELLIQIRNPLWLFFGLFQPIVYLILFSPFLQGIANAPGFPTQNAIQFFAPGLLIMNVLFGASFAGFGLIDQLRTGFIERIRVTPVSRLAIVLGLVFRSPIVILVQSVLLLITALFFGLQIHLLGLLIFAVLLLIMGVGMASLSFAIALIAKDEGTLAAITNFFTLPFMLLSGIMLPLTFAPHWIRVIAIFDPFAYAVDSARALINGAIGDPSVLTAFIVFIILSIITLGWFIRVMRKAVS